MTQFLSREQVRAVDRRAIEEYGVPGVMLMENAGRSAAELLLRLGARGPVTVCAGKGNNGGDGFVIARHLDIHRIPVRVLLFARPGELTGDAATNYRIIEKSGLPLAVFGPDVDEPTVRRVVRLINLNEYKRRQAAPGLKVTTKAFGVGRRVPVAQRHFES